MLLKLDHNIFNIDLSHLVPYVAWHHVHCYFPMEVGQNHHRLLAYLSSQLPSGSKVADLGTNMGASALALSYNREVRVQTYDICGVVDRSIKSFHSVENIHYTQDDCFLHIDDFIDAKIILLDINPHNGLDEQRMLEELISRKYKGLLILDDIHLSKEMEDFYNSITLDKYDATTYGHHSGTGIVVFDKKSINIAIT